MSVARFTRGLTIAIALGRYPFSIHILLSLYYARIYFLDDITRSFEFRFHILSSAPFAPLHAVRLLRFHLQFLYYLLA
jgi:hypothetical protein